MIKVLFHIHTSSDKPLQRGEAIHHLALQGAHLVGYHGTHMAQVDARSPCASFRRQRRPLCLCVAQLKFLGSLHAWRVYRDEDTVAFISVQTKRL